MTSSEPLCTIVFDVDRRPIGHLATGTKVDVLFTGTATSHLWDGEWSVEGVDYLVAGADGITRLDVRGRISNGDRIIAYSATGRGTSETGPHELIVFETADAELSHLNSVVAVAFGDIDGSTLTLAVERLTP